MDRDLTTAPGCTRDPSGIGWRGFGLRGQRSWGPGLRALGRVRSSGGCPFIPLFPSGPHYSSDLRHMQMTRSVDSVQFLPFLTTDVNNLSWLSYGVLKGDGTLIVVNTVGAVLQTLYVLVYLHYCPQKTATLLGVLLLGYGYFWLLVPDPAARLQQLGLFCSVFTISMYLSPLADLAKVIQTKSTKRLSFSLTIATLLTSASWSLYGFRLKDPYIMVPNLPGIITSFIRLWLFWKYRPEQDRNYRLLQT
ncbi:sugar transporter SWEET1 isoform X2 [Dipodomys spectabilis]|uniref:sugar transporter SWEET1 isoform X2 n=1 Tax=Dipodomys spectabilis TaxID=105255 RepID=UPI001C546025|nr:sugar transporter SWEET1 isoform X2 [Dipodomys spectabilis]